MTLDKTDVNILLVRTAAAGETDLYAKLMGGWLKRSRRSQATFDLTSDEEAAVRAHLLPTGPR